jgi:magnesium-transporting ATPase (P-type)
MKNKDDRELLHFSNSLEMGSVLFFLALFLRNIFGYLYIYAWLAILILQFLAESLIFHAPIQYGTDKVSMVVLLILATVIQMISDWLSFRKRRSWQDDQSTYKVYHHNGHVAEWVNTKASEIKPGNVFRLSPG